jgi:hypothetical protein
MAESVSTWIAKGVCKLSFILLRNSIHFLWQMNWMKFAALETSLQEQNWT